VPNAGEVSDGGPVAQATPTLRSSGADLGSAAADGGHGRCLTPGAVPDVIKYGPICYHLSYSVVFCRILDMHMYSHASIVYVRICIEYFVYYISHLRFIYDIFHTYTHIYIYSVIFIHILKYTVAAVYTLLGLYTTVGVSTYPLSLHIFSHIHAYSRIFTHIQALFTRIQAHIQAYSRIFTKLRVYLRI